MTRLRLLPIVLFAISALLVLKVLGLVTGTGSFAVGPAPAVAAGGAPADGHGAPAGDAEPNIEDPLIIEAPLDLAEEAKQLAKQKASADGHGGGDGAPADGHGAPADAHGAAPAADGHGEAAAADGHGEAPAADGHGGAAAADGHGAPADGQGAAPAADGHGEAPAAEGQGEAAAADGHGAPAADGHGAAPAADDHGAASDGHGKSDSTVKYTTVRPEEFKPAGNSSEPLVLESLAKRRTELDQREQDIEMRMKLLDAAELRVQKRIEELRSMEQQLGGAPAEQEKEASEKVKGLVTLYENMKPKAAAAVFDELPVNVLLPIAQQMNPRKLAAVLGAMAPDKAGRLTAYMAGDQGPKRIVVRGEGDVPAVSAAPGASGPSAQELPKIMPAPGG